MNETLNKKDSTINGEEKAGFGFQLLVIFIVLAVGIGTSGYLYYKSLKKQLVAATNDQLSTVADLKVKQLVSWRNDRLEDAAYVLTQPFFVPFVHQYLDNPMDPDLAKKVFSWMKVFQEDKNYKTVMLTDAQGNARLCVPQNAKPLRKCTPPLIAEALRTRKIIFSDFHFDPDERSILLSLVIPLCTSSARDAVPFGFIMLEIDPHQFLYPFMQTWPTSSETAETLLVRKEGNDVVYLNELRHRKNTALTLRLPISRADLPAALAVQGKTGIVEGVDYRGVPVLAILRKIPDSPWLLVAKIDQQEVSGLVKTQTRFVAIIIALLVVFSGAVVGLLWRHQKSQFYKRRYETERKLAGERKWAEEKIRRLNEGLEQRVIERTAQLEAANKELEAFSYSTSHDLRVPLRAIEGFSRILLTEYQDKLDDEGKRLLLIVSDNTRKMGELIDDLLRFSRTSKKEMVYFQVDTETLVRSVFDDLKPLFDGRNVAIELKPLPSTMGDYALLRQAFINLLDNALKFTRDREAAKIDVEGTENETETIYSIRDNGAGFDMQYAHKLFGVFQRLHGQTEFEGTGIGLAMVQRIIHRHGGRVWAEGKVNQGATFFFSLPREKTFTVSAEEKNHGK